MNPSAQSPDYLSLLSQSPYLKIKTNVSDPHETSCFNQLAKIVATICLGFHENVNEDSNAMKVSNLATLHCIGKYFKGTEKMLLGCDIAALRDRTQYNKNVPLLLFLEKLCLIVWDYSKEDPIEEFLRFTTFSIDKIIEANHYDVKERRNKILPSCAEQLKMALRRWEWLCDGLEFDAQTRPAIVLAYDQFEPAFAHRRGIRSPQEKLIEWRNLREQFLQFICTERTPKPEPTIMDFDDILKLCSEPARPKKEKIQKKRKEGEAEQPVAQKAKASNGKKSLPAPVELIFQPAADFDKNLRHQLAKEGIQLPVAIRIKVPLPQLGKDAHAIVLAEWWAVTPAGQPIHDGKTFMKVEDERLQEEIHTAIAHKEETRHNGHEMFVVCSDVHSKEVVRIAFLHRITKVQVTGVDDNVHWNEQDDFCHPFYQVEGMVYSSFHESARALGAVPRGGDGFEAWEVLLPLPSLAWLPVRRLYSKHADIAVYNHPSFLPEHDGPNVWDHLLVMGHKLDPDAQCEPYCFVGDTNKPGSHCRHDKIIMKDSGVKTIHGLMIVEYRSPLAYQMENTKRIPCEKALFDITEKLSPDTYPPDLLDTLFAFSRIATRRGTRTTREPGVRSSPSEFYGIPESLPPPERLAALYTRLYSKCNIRFHPDLDIEKLEEQTVYLNYYEPKRRDIRSKLFIPDSLTLPVKFGELRDEDEALVQNLRNFRLFNQMFSANSKRKPGQSRPHCNLISPDHKDKDYYFAAKKSAKSLFLSMRNLDAEAEEIMREVDSWYDLQPKEGARTDLTLEECPEDEPIVDAIEAKLKTSGPYGERMCPREVFENALLKHWQRQMWIANLENKELKFDRSLSNICSRESEKPEISDVSESLQAAQTESRCQEPEPGTEGGVPCAETAPEVMMEVDVSAVLSAEESVHFG